MAKLISKKEYRNLSVFKVRILGKKTVSFVIKRGDHFSHGSTIKEAKESLKYKISNRDTTEYKKWKLDTVVTQEKMIQSYMAITGACGLGVRHFCEGKNFPSKLSVSEAIEITRGQYSSNEFMEFFTSIGVKEFA